MKLREFEVRASNEEDEWDESPGSLITSHEGINTKQQRLQERDFLIRT